VSAEQPRSAVKRVRSGLRLGVAGLFVASGVLHVVKPSAFDEFMPDWVPQPVAVNIAAGVVEIACAYGLVTRRRWAGPASAVVLLAVWPSNLAFAINATQEDGLTSTKALLGWARMPLQIPMIWAVLSPVEETWSQVPPGGGPTEANVRSTP
jgi:uncharacterized membrane protein